MVRGGLMEAVVCFYLQESERTAGRGRSVDQQLAIIQASETKVSLGSLTRPQTNIVVAVSAVNICGIPPPTLTLLPEPQHSAVSINC